MHAIHQSEDELLSVSEVTIVVGSLCWHIAGTSLAGSSMDCHVSITFLALLPGLVCSSLGLSSAHLKPSQGHSPLMHFFFYHTICH